MKSMQALILAAGIAQRLRPLTDHCPKCLLQIGGKNFLQRMVDNLLWAGINDIVIVTGYLQQQIQSFLSEKYPGLPFTFIFNEYYETTNNSYSLWLARKAIQDDFILLDSDIVFDKRILSLLIESDKEGALIAVNRDIDLGEEEMKVQINENGQITAISKEIPPSNAIGESIGIELFDQTIARKLFDQLNYNIMHNQESHLFYEKTFQDLIDLKENFYYVDITGYKVIEVDFAEDLHNAEQNILPFIE